MIRKLINLFLSVILIALSFSPALSQAQGHKAVDNVGQASGGLIDQLNENIKKQNELRQKIADAKDQQKTLANEISYLENQIELTRLEIQEALDRLTQLKGDISDTSQKLAEVADELNYSTEIANNRIRQLYRQSYVQGADVLITSDNFNNYLITQVYAQAVREQDLSLLESLKKTKLEFTTQKKNLEDKKSKEENLKQTLEEKKGTLFGQNNEKQYLLGVTKNQEANYERLLAQVQIEIESISRALGGGAIRLGPVKKGEVLAFEGNTGCSTGSHLHWGVYVNGVAVNPRTYINNGRLAWPERGFRITQEFGENFDWYMRNFGLPGHNAIDMTAGFGTPIYASADGIAYAASDSQACWLTGTVGKGVIVDHGGGLKTIYWHIK